MIYSSGLRSPGPTHKLGMWNLIALTVTRSDS